MRLLIILALLLPPPPQQTYVLEWTSFRPATHAIARSSTGFDPWNHISVDGRTGWLGVDFERACLTIDAEVFYADGTGSFHVTRTWTEGCERQYFPLVGRP